MTRETPPTSSRCLDLENERIIQQIEIASEEDVVKDIGELLQKFKLCDTLPSNFVHIPTQTYIIFSSISYIDSPPKLIACIRIHPDLSFDIFIR